MRSLQVGDRVEMVCRNSSVDEYYSTFKNPGTVDGITPDGEYVDVFDANGRSFGGGRVERYKLLDNADQYMIHGDDTIYTLYSMAEEAARAMATDCGDPIAIAKVIAYAKPTVSITVERV